MFLRKQKVHSDFFQRLRQISTYKCAGTNYLLKPLHVCVMKKSMSSKIYDKEHLFVTAKQSREKDVNKATVIHTGLLSKTVKSISLKLENSEASFRAGQWVDFFVPSLPNFVGGYSICSSPEKLKLDGIIDLAVKIAEYPTAKWIHEKCEVNSKVNIRIGGDFFYDPSAEFYSSQNHQHDLLLIAGGVGINPILSILQHTVHVIESGFKYSPSAVTLLYSAKSEEDLIFKDSINSLCEKYFLKGMITHRYFITDEKIFEKDDNNVHQGRITSNDIIQSLSSFKTSQKLVYICGPSNMLTFVKSVLTTALIPKNNVRYEKWW